jgi:hypothetical protein
VAHRTPTPVVTGNGFLARGPLPCHDQAVVDLSKVARRVDVLSDLMGLAVGVMLLATGIKAYRDGGSMGWPAAGLALLLINFCVAGRRLARRRKPTPSS